jgi:hypothetical protein
MRNMIMGGIGVLWGGAILLYTMLGDRPQGQGAYGAGQMAGTIFGLLLLLAGLYYLIQGLRSSGQTAKTKTKKKKRRQTEEE